MRRRNIIKIGMFTSLATDQMISCTSSQQKENEVPLLVAEATPAGIMAAIAAVRAGAKVILIDYQNHIGGMSASGPGNVFTTFGWNCHTKFLLGKLIYL